MKTWKLFALTLATVVLTGSVLRQAGWFRSRADHTPSEVRPAPRESLSSKVVLRHGQQSPQHWRDCLLPR
jgi:hypothetical protein